MRPPRPACGERSDRIADAIRVRGLTAYSHLSNLQKQPLTPTLSPRSAGRGRGNTVLVSRRDPDDVVRTAAFAGGTDASLNDAETGLVEAL